MTASDRERPTIKEVIDRYDLMPKKSLGQNFLLDLSLTQKIARCASLTNDDIVIEVGSGPGALTRALLESEAHKIYAIEKDERAIKAADLLKDWYGERFEILNADALTIDTTRFAMPGKHLKIVANLPYNISTTLLISWLHQVKSFDCFVLMFQKEVADRLVAKSDTKAYGRLSILSQWLCTVEKCFDIAPVAFYPPPKIVSTVVRFTPKKDLTFDAEDFKILETLTHHAFGQRRKMLRQSLKGLIPEAESVLQSLGLDPSLRAENLTIDDFLTLKDYVKERKHLLS
jgi:16S rRNA (adenine1518-N6/adenine1519-N6)-dimethyltransferase